MLRTNEDSLVKLAVQGDIQHPGKVQDFIVDGEGMANVLPSTGGICYNYQVGDNCMNLAGDHVEPGVTTYNPSSDFARNAYNLYSCIGNEARVVTGNAKGAKGYVSGLHDMSNVMIHFEQDVLEQLSLDDKILVKSHGQGLKLLDYPDVHVTSVDPNLFNRIPIKEQNGKLIVPVTKTVPAYLMGSGIGGSSAHRSDYDIMTQDKEVVKKLGLEDLRFGDLVYLENCDNTYGRGFYQGAGTIGVISHSDCLKPGHGPGVTTILSSRNSIIEYRIDGDANIMNYQTVL